MNSAKQSIQFHFTDVRFSFSNRTATKEMIRQLIYKEGHSIEHINYIFCSDGYLLELNKEHLKHNTLTDIITFHYHTTGKPILSDIYISVDRVKENAQTFGVSFRHELYRVLFHGTLHLCGYKDKSKKEKTLMRQMEELYLQMFHVSRGTNQK